MGSRSRLGALAVAITVGCASSGCAVISLGGAPIAGQGSEESDPLSKPFQRMIAMPPNPHWIDPADTIIGLQSAMASFDDPDRKVLRQYLTPEAQAKWTPDGPVTVLDDLSKLQMEPDKTDADLGTVTVEATEVATIEVDGRYVPSTEKTPKIIRFGVVKTPAGYRVSSLPAGLLLTSADVDRAYQATNLYFLNGPPGNPVRIPDALVVDRVRLRIDPSEKFAETIVKQLLKGPSDALKGAVFGAFPDGTRLKSIKSADGMIVVDLDGDFSSGPPSDGMKAQLQWSLREVTKGRTIEVRLNGEPFVSGRQELIEPRASDRWLAGAGADKKVYYTNGGSLSWMGDEGPGTPAEGEAAKKGGGHTEPAISGDGLPWVAAKENDDAIVVSSLGLDGHWQPWITGKNLTAPTWHRDGTLWAVDRIGERQSQVVRYRPSEPDQTRRQERVSAPALDTVGVEKLRISRDGVRVAAVVRDASGVHVTVGAIVGAIGTPWLGNWQTLLTAEEKDKVVDIAWRDPEHLLVLVGGEENMTIKEINVGDGIETDNPPPPDTRIQSLTAVGDRILAGTKEEDGESVILELDEKAKKWKPQIKGDVGPPAFPLG